MTNSGPRLSQTMEEVARRLLTESALGENLMERIVSFSNVKRAWQQVKANHGAPGIDGMTTQEFPTYARLEWRRIRRELLEGTYQPSPAKRSMIFPLVRGDGVKHSLL